MVHFWPFPGGGRSCVLMASSKLCLPFISLWSTLDGFGETRLTFRPCLSWGAQQSGCTFSRPPLYALQLQATSGHRLDC